jgi:ribosomal protein S21
MSYINIDEIRKRRGNSKSDPLTIGLREFKRKVKEAGIIEEVRERSFYKSPSEKRRFKKKESFRRKKREENKKNRQSNG